MKRLLFQTIYFLSFTLVYVFSAFMAFSTERKALIIGINIYEPKGGIEAVVSDRLWINLDGSVNDALSMKNILINQFDFSEENIITLTTPEQTTRAQLIKGFEKLASMTQEGDEIFIYYAGHGSQIINSRSSEVDKLDETIVPSDSYTGIIDIRDKELNELFAQIQDKGGKLTVIFDSCNSGSVSRSSGLPVLHKTRAIRRDERDVKEAYTPIDIAEKGALVISASQDYELAKEFTDPDGQKHGAFTYAFMKALRESSPNESALNLFKKTCSILLYMGVPSQHPVFEGNLARSQQNLLGSPLNESITKVAVSGKEKETVELNGGFAMGLAKGTVLKSLKNDQIELQVSEMQGINRCIAKVIKGSISAIEIGDFFKIMGLPFFGNNALKVWYTCSAYRVEDLQKIRAGIATIATKYQLRVLGELSEKNTSIKLLYNGVSWQLENACGEQRILPNQFELHSFEEGIKSLIHSGCMNFGNTIWVNYPPVQGLSDLMDKSFLHDASGVEKTSHSPNATYWLHGKFNTDGQLEYAWQYAELSSGNYPLPKRSNWVVFQNDRNTFEHLYQSSAQISKLYAWMTLPSPTNEVSFPYTLAVKDVTHNQLIAPESKITENTVYEFVLLKDKNLYPNWRKGDRFIYVFMMDSEGKMTLVFPRNSSVENNTYTLAKGIEGNYLDEVSIPKSRFKISPPFGADTFFMLSTKEPLNDPWVLESPAILTRSITQTTNPIELLLRKDLKRSDTEKNMSDWYLEKFTLYSEKDVK